MIVGVFLKASFQPRDMRDYKLILTLISNLVVQESRLDVCCKNNKRKKER